MKERTSRLNRCQAVANHGRRCMQTPYVTSPFCWHHTAGADRDALRRDDLRNDDQAKVSVERIINALGAARLAEIVNIIETEGPDAIRIEHDDRVLGTRSEQAAV